jgi:hypothetical protein
MPRSRQRVCLQDGLKLDLNWLARNGFVQFGANTGFREIRWTHSYWGEIANGLITADMSDPAEAWLRVEIGNSVQTWGRQVAYSSQFQDATNRAHLGKARIKSRLIGSLDPGKWELPPKPKWMRWKTYNRHVERFDQYEAELEHGCALMVEKLSGLKLL